MDIKIKKIKTEVRTADWLKEELEAGRMWFEEAETKKGDLALLLRGNSSRNEHMMHIAHIPFPGTHPHEDVFSIPPQDIFDSQKPIENKFKFTSAAIQVVDSVASQWRLERTQNLPRDKQFKIVVSFE